MKQYYLSYRPRTECSISQFFKTNCTQSIFRTISCGLLAKPLKKFPKSPIQPASLTFNERQIFKGFITMCNLEKRLIPAEKRLTPASDVHERLKTNSTAIKIARETTNNYKKKYNSVKHLQRQQFSFTKISIKAFRKILSLKA